jgi:uncharacterized protein (DUF433 family)
MSTVTYAHIEIDARGTALVAGTRTKVLEVALDHLAHHWDAEEIRRQHPYLSLGQIHSALAYYFDHREALDREIAAQVENVDRLHQAAGPSPALMKSVRQKKQR